MNKLNNHGGSYRQVIASSFSRSRNGSLPVALVCELHVYLYCYIRYSLFFLEILKVENTYLPHDEMSEVVGTFIISPFILYQFLC